MEQGCINLLARFAEGSSRQPNRHPTATPNRHTTRKALVVAEQVIRSRLQAAGSALSRRAPEPLARLAAAALPSVAEGRVPTVVSLTLGKNDAGESPDRSVERRTQMFII
jgi:hypothetical protein